MDQIIEFYIKYYYFITFILTIIIVIAIMTPLLLLNNNKTKLKIQYNNIDDYNNVDEGLNYSFKDIGLTISGYEEDYWLSINDLDNFTVSELLNNVGIQPITWQEAEAFGNDLFTGDSFLKYKEKYCNKTGREFPPVYKIKMNISAERLSEKETEEFWEKKQLENEDLDPID